ncbi:MAG: type I-MYXAN CRISPR-associated protein Cas6/Cmx6 [Usitatibacter sp.]
MNPTGPEMVDVAFDLAASSLPAGYEWPLFRAIARVVPWIERSARAGIHPLRASRAADGSLLVPRRAKLVVRMPRERVCAASALERAGLDVAGVSVRIGGGAVRNLEPAATLYSARVVTGDGEEEDFRERIVMELHALGIDKPFICGKRSNVDLEDGPVPAFSVAVHDLGQDASLALQDAGLGRGRAIGCGLFVPHKTIPVLA